MLNFNKGISYEEYISSATDEEYQIIQRYEKQCKLFEKGIEEILCVDNVINVAVFSITRCQDAATAIPFLMKLSDLNNKINIKFFYREGNEELLYDLSGEKRIPTMLVLNEENKVIRKFIEFPQYVDELIQKNPADKENIVKDYRSGKYNRYLQEDLIKLISGN